jgi:hypothetical protein
MSDQNKSVVDDTLVQMPRQFGKSSSLIDVLTHDDDGKVFKPELVMLKSEQSPYEEVDAEIVEEPSVTPEDETTAGFSDDEPLPTAEDIDKLAKELTQATAEFERLNSKEYLNAQLKKAVRLQTRLNNKIVKELSRGEGRKRAFPKLFTTNNEFNELLAICKYVADACVTEDHPNPPIFLTIDGSPIEATDPKGMEDEDLAFPVRAFRGEGKSMMYDEVSGRYFSSDEDSPAPIVFWCRHPMLYKANANWGGAVYYVGSTILIPGNPTLYLDYKTKQFSIERRYR